MASPIDAIPQQAIADDPTLLSIAQSWIVDLLSQQIPGSVVLLIVLVAFIPTIIRAVMAYWKRK